MLRGLYPTRSLIRFKAKSQLMAELTGESLTTRIHRNGMSTLETVEPSTAESAAYCEQLKADEPLNEELFKTIADQVFQPDLHPELYWTYPSQASVDAVETRLVAEIVAAYQTACLEQRRQVVNRLNVLLTES